MDTSTAIVIIVIVLSAVFLVVAMNFRKVKGNISTSLIKGNFEGDDTLNEKSSGNAHVSNIQGKNVEIGNVLGAEGKNIIEGKAKVDNIDALEDVKIDTVIGIDTSDRDSNEVSN